MNCCLFSSFFLSPPPLSFSLVSLSLSFYCSVSTIYFLVVCLDPRLLKSRKFAFLQPMEMNMEFKIDIHSRWSLGNTCRDHLKRAKKKTNKSLPECQVIEVDSVVFILSQRRVTFEYLAFSKKMYSLASVTVHVWYRLNIYPISSHCGSLTPHVETGFTHVT